MTASQTGIEPVSMMEIEFKIHSTAVWGGKGPQPDRRQDAVCASAAMWQRPSH
jgi:hypothetical protein